MCPSPGDGRLFLQSMCILRGQGAIPTAGLGMEQVSCRVSRGSGPRPAPHWSILGRGSPTEYKPTAPHPDLCLFTNEDEAGGYWRVDRQNAPTVWVPRGHGDISEVHSWLVLSTCSMLLFPYFVLDGSVVCYPTIRGQERRPKVPMPTPPLWDARNSHTGVRTASRQVWPKRSSWETPSFQAISFPEP